MSEKTHSLQVEGNTIDFTLIFSQRKTTAIHVHRDRRVTVRAPSQTALADVESFVRSKASWILRKQQEFAALSERAPRQFVDEEVHHFLGRPYRLRIVQAQHEVVRLTASRLHIWALDKEDKARLRRLVDDWYDREAHAHFSKRLTALMPRFKRVGVRRPQVTISRMKTRWGSSRTNGRISLNTKLMQTPEPCIDYVIVHELCHQIEHNHGRKFYALLERLMPDWRERRDRLNEFPVG